MRRIIRHSRACFRSAALPARTREFGSEAIRKHRESLGLQMKPQHDPAALGARMASPGNAVYTTKIMKAAKHKDWSQAKAAFDTIEKKNTIVYTAIIAAADRCEKYEEGLDMFRQMSAAGFEANAVTYCSVFSVAAMARGSVEVEQLMKVAIEQGLKLNQAHFGALLKAHRKEGNYTSALKVLHEMRAHDQPTIMHYTLALGACSAAASTGNLRETDVKHFNNELLREMKKDAIARDAFFVEEQIRAMFGGQPLQNIKDMSSLSEEQRSMALSCIQEAKKEGAMSKLLLTLRSRLEAALDATPALPVGWEATLDPATGKFYYWNTATRETTWTLPVA